MDALKKLVLTILDESGMEYHFNGDQRHCVNSTVNICIPGVVSEALMIMAKQYCSISNGSACTSKNYSPSYVLKAMEIPEEEHGTLLLIIICVLVLQLMEMQKIF